MRYKLLNINDLCVVFYSIVFLQAHRDVRLKQNKLELFLVASQFQHGQVYNVNSQTTVVVSTVIAKLSFLDCLSLVPLTALNGLVFIQRFF